MTTKQILNLDYRKKESQDIIQRVLKQIKPLSKYSDECEIPLSAIEKAITIMCKKYKMRIKEIMPDLHANEQYTIWCATLFDDEGLKIVDSIYGISLYELLAKAAIRLYAEVKKGLRNK